MTTDVGPFFATRATVLPDTALIFPRVLAFGGGGGVCVAEGDDVADCSLVDVDDAEDPGWDWFAEEPHPARRITTAERPTSTSPARVRALYVSAVICSLLPTAIHG